MSNLKANDTTLSPQVEKGFATQPDGTRAEVVVAVAGAVTDAAGDVIYPQSMSHTYGYDVSGVNVVTDTATDGTSTWVKTYTYSGNNVVTASKWVKQ